MRAYISIIKHIIRYRVLQINNKYYIVDIEENPRFFLFPFLTWFHIYTLYELEEDQARKISDYNKTKGPDGREVFSTLYFFIVGISLTLGKVVASSGLAYIPFINNTIVHILFLLLAIGAVVYFRIIQYRKTYEKMHQLVDLKPLNKKYARFYPINKLNYVYLLFMWLFFLGFAFLASALFLQLSILLGLLGFWTFISLAAVAYRFFIHPKYKYTCTFYE